MKKKKISRILAAVMTPFIAIAVLMCFLIALSNVSETHSIEDKKRLEDTIRQAAVTCYSVEGRYPSELSYLESRYGIQIDSRRFVVHYTAIAENLMPDITVLEK